MFWAEKIKEKLRGRSGQFLVEDMATPSGKPHVGTLRGAIIHDVISRALNEDKKETTYNFVCNDLDPFDKIPAYLPQKKYQKYLGLPMINVPAPVGENSFSQFYIEQIYEIMRGIGCHFNEVYDSVMYRDGVFDKAIKIALDEAGKIRKIYKEISGSEKPEDWYPFQPICENCGKIGTTRSYDWDGKVVSYECDPNLVEWADGCGYRGKVSPFGGTGKLPWKVQWPAAWYSFGVTVEGEGKDHSSAGGSRDLGNHLSKEVFKTEPPIDIPYEHLIYGGKKMSKSKGIGITAEEIYQSLAPEIIRFLMIRHPERVIDLDLGGTVIPGLYDDYDKSRDAFLGKLDFPDLAKAFYYSQTKKDFESGYVVRFYTLANLVQIPGINVENWAINDKGSALTIGEKKELESRTQYARIWLSKYASSEFRFDIKKELPKVRLSLEEKKFLEVTLDQLKKSQPVGTMQNLLKTAINESKITPKSAYVALYKIFLGKESGPRAALMLEALKLEELTNRIERALQSL